MGNKLQNNLREENDIDKIKSNYLNYKERQSNSDEKYILFGEKYLKVIKEKIELFKKDEEDEEIKKMNEQETMEEECVEMEKVHVISINDNKIIIEMNKEEIKFSLIIGLSFYKYVRRFKYEEIRKLYKEEEITKIYNELIGVQ